jgi:protein-tyrosine phosphatase
VREKLFDRRRKTAEKSAGDVYVFRFSGDAKQYFPLVNAHIRQAVGSGHSVLVHCMASLSRSVCFLIAYLMEDHNMPLVDATAFVKAKWDATYPNDSFVFQLIEYERELEAARKAKAN